MLLNQSQDTEGPGDWLTGLHSSLGDGDRRVGEGAPPVPDLPPGKKVQKISDLPAPKYELMSAYGGHGGIGVGSLQTSLSSFSREAAERSNITWHQRGERGLTLSVLWSRSGPNHLFFLKDTEPHLLCGALTDPCVNDRKVPLLPGQHGLTLGEGLGDF